MNRFLNVVLRESILDSPFASKEKLAGLSAGDVLGGVLGFFGSAMNAISQQDANTTNLKIARMNRDLQQETNAQNYKMFQEQNAWNLDQWNRQNDYNLPIRQVARLQNAGLNPSAFFGQATPAGQVQSQQSPSFVAPQLNYQQQPVDYSGFGNSVGQAINAYYENQLKSAQTKNVGAVTENTVVQTEKERKSMTSYLEYLRNQAKREGIAGDMAKRELDFFNSAYEMRIGLIQGDAAIQKKNMDMIDKQLVGIDLDNTFKEIQNAYQSRLNDRQLRNLDATLSQIHAQIGLINANKLLTDEQRLHEVEKKVGQTLANGVSSINFETQKEIKESIVQSYKNSANIGLWEAYDKWKHNPYGNNRGVADAFGIDYLPDFMETFLKSHHYVPKLK